MKKNLFLILSAAALLVSCGEPSTSKPAEGGKSSEPQVTTPSQAGGDSSSDPESSDSGSRDIAEVKNVQFVDSSQQYTHIYIFKGSDPVVGAWPGAALTDHAYTAELTIGVQYGVIFNAGEGGAQTTDMMVTIGDISVYHYTSGAGFDESPVATVKLTIIDETQGWTHIYAWGAATTAAWPGDELVDHQYTFEGLPAGVNVNFILNKDGGKTKDLSYTLGQADATIKVDAEENIVPAN